MKAPHRRDLPSDVRAYVEKLRGNALVLAVKRLGGRLELTPEAMDEIRGHGVRLDTTPDGLHTFVVDKLDDRR